MDPIEYVRRLEPFAALDEHDFAPVAANLEIAYLSRGEQILSVDGPPSTHLLIVRKGIVILERDGTTVMTVEPGEWFGFPSLLSEQRPRYDAVAAEDVLLYRIPAKVVRELVPHPSVAAHITEGLATRLRAAGPAVPPTGAATDLSVAIGELVANEPVVMEGDATVGEAAQRMRREKISSVLVSDPQLGIVTDRDLRNRVLAEGLGADTLLRSVASSPVRSVTADTPVADAVVRMIDHGFHHLAVCREEDVIGVVTSGDLLRHQSHSPVHLVRRIEHATSPRDLLDVADGLHGVVGTLVSSGLAPLKVARAATTVADVLTRRLLTLAERDLGSPPAPYAWLALGSQARREQTLLTDQDSALVFGDVDEDGRAYFAALAERTVNGLIGAGVAPCPGGTMATRWAGTLAEWRDRFERWVDLPDERALLEASIFFDFRVVSGELDVGALDDVLQVAGGDRVFLARLSAAALAARPPLGLFRRIRESVAGTVDLKAGGILPVVDLARLLALEAASHTRATVDRLRAASDTGRLSEEGAETLIEAFSFLQQLRLHAQLDAVAAGREPKNEIDPDRLGPTERRHLKEAFVAIAETQQVTVDRLGGYGVSR